jgi:protein gp37
VTTGSKIEWCDHTFNPWWGCARVSPGCRFCYAERDARRYGHQVWGRHGPRRLLSEANWRLPLRWDRDAERAGVPALVFCASMADVFEDHPQVVESRQRLWRLIEDTPHLRWLLLTKRPENVPAMVPRSWAGAWPEQVWLAGVSWLALPKWM